MVPLTHVSQTPKPHLSWLSLFAGLTNVINRQTYRPRYSVYSNRPHLDLPTAATRPEIHQCFSISAFQRARQPSKIA